MPAKLVILISGNGSNLQAIIDACEDKSLPANILAVISNIPGVFGLSRAEKAGIKTIVLPKLTGESRRDYDLRLADEVANLHVDYVVLAGWMRLLTFGFLEPFSGRVINLHPALPGTFPGSQAMERAYAAFLRGEIDRSGVMVHLVMDEGVDNGPVLSCQEIVLEPGETWHQFETRMHATEHRLLVATLKDVISGNLKS